MILKNSDVFQSQFQIPYQDFDFSGLVFISSAGLRSLLITAKKLEAKKGWIALTSPKDVVKKIFEISGFHSLIPTYESVEAALEQI